MNSFEMHELAYSIARYFLIRIGIVLSQFSILPLHRNCRLESSSRKVLSKTNFLSNKSGGPKPDVTLCDSLFGRLYNTARCLEG